MRERMDDIARRAALPLAVGTVLGLLGPFGTYGALPLPARLGYWLAVVALNWMIADALIRRAEALVSAGLPLRRAAVPMTGALAAALPATGVVALAGQLAGLGWPGDLVVLLGQVALLMGAIALPVYAYQDLRETSAAPAPAPTPAPAPAPGIGRPGTAPLFLARLPCPPDGQLLCLEMQDHYMVVHSTGGSQMILCRMEDAARELGCAGRRVHRSWWVARDAVLGARRDGQRRWLKLLDGRDVPVGRSYAADLRAAGWLK